MVELIAAPPDTRTAAFALARRGLRVFPLPAGRKDPPIENFSARATADGDTVRGWWTDPFGDTTEGNIGIATGGGLIVIDFDMKPGQHGAQSLFALEMQGLPDQTLTVRTASGGEHRYFRVPTGFRVANSVGKIAANVDVRGEGGYVVAPGSTTSAGAYTIARDVPIADAPVWLLERCGQAKERTGDAAIPLVELDAPGAVARAVEYLRHGAEPAIEGAGGDLTAFKVAAMVKDLGVSEPQAVTLMLDHWNERCAPPWQPEDIERKVANAYSYGHSAPGVASAAAEFDAVPLSAAPPLGGRGAAASKFKRISARQSAALAPEAAGDPLIEGLWDRGAMSVLYGASNEGKTFVMLDLAFHVAAGRPWNGRATRKGLVIYVVAEGGRQIHKRTAAFLAAHDVRDELLDLIVQPVDLLDPAADLRALVAEVKAAAEEHGVPVELIVIDTLSRALAGGDENSSVDMGAIVKNLDRLRAETGAHIAVVHHTGKDKARGARGHSLLRAATDTELEVADGKLAATKQRDMAERVEVAFGLRDVEIGGQDTKGRPLISAIVTWRGAAEFTEPLPLTGAEHDALEALRAAAAEKPRGVAVSTNEWNERIRASVKPGSPEPSRQRLDDHRRALTEKGFVRRAERGQWVLGAMTDMTANDGMAADQ